MLGFMGIILAGTLLLMLPFSSSSGHWTSFPDALFTAVSATCVTGLVVVNTATYWSGFGQLIILLLIQIGGMGFMMVALLFAMLAGKRIGLHQRNIMQETISANHVGGIVRLTNFIMKGLLIVEGGGAIILSLFFIKDYGFLKGIWYGIFHSVSAFCNAGFDLCGTQVPFCSLTNYVASPLINIVICGLIIIGGLGFLTWRDLYEQKLNYHRYRLQTKLILMMTAVLIFLPFLYFFLLEFRGQPLNIRFWGSFFQAVTPRTAGFNTMDYGAMSENGKLITILLMLTGGAPGSTAGGMKITTLAVITLVTLTIFKRKSHVTVHKRSIAQSTIYHAISIFMMYIGLFLIGSLLMTQIEGLPLIDCMFEIASALGTVGLTVGITTRLSLATRMILIVLMFSGRVGGLTLIYAAVPQTYSHSQFVNENVSVG